jgi:membrane-associated phospholipid phosphatase
MTTGRPRAPYRAIALAVAALAAAPTRAHAAGPAFAPQPQPQAHAQAPASPAMPTPLDGLAEDAAEAFTGTSLLFHAAAVASTGVMAFGGADHALRVGVQRSLVVSAYGDAALYGGYVVPAMAAPGIYVVGLVAKDRITAGAGAAAVQALAMALATTGVLKVAVGRVYPSHGGDPSAPDRLDHPEYAHEFTPFAGVLAWPSGHTMGTTSVVAALTAYYPESPAVPLVGYPLALAIGFGMVDGDRHWTSDVLAGALIGHAIGYAVGRGFRRRVREGRREAGLRPAPMVGRGVYGLCLTLPW